MPNPENLQRTLSPSEARKNGRKGGIASGKKRREMKAARDIAKMLLALPISPSQKKIAEVAENYGIDTGRFDQKGLMLMANMLKAQKGDSEATKLMLSLVDELPASKQQTAITGPNEGPVLVMGAEVTAETLQRARQIAEAVKHGEP